MMGEPLSTTFYHPSRLHHLPPSTTLYHSSRLHHLPPSTLNCGLPPFLLNSSKVMGRNGVSSRRAAKDVLSARHIEDPEHKLRTVLTDLGVSLDRCLKARFALTNRDDAQPLETILTGLTTAGVSDALARQICGLDTDAPAADALRRCREAISAKRTRDAGEGSGNGETPAAKVARPEGTHLRHSHEPWPVAAAPRVCPLRANELPSWPYAADAATSAASTLPASSSAASASRDDGADGASSAGAPCRSPPPWCVCLGSHVPH